MDQGHLRCPAGPKDNIVAIWPQSEQKAICHRPSNTEAGPTVASGSYHLHNVFIRGRIWEYHSNGDIEFGVLGTTGEDKAPKASAQSTYGIALEADATLRVAERLITLR